MIVRPPAPISTAIRIGTQRGLSRSSRGTGGVYRVDAATRLPAAADPDADVDEAGRESPGLVPFGVTRPVVFLLGGATGGESTLRSCPGPVSS